MSTDAASATAIESGGTCAGMGVRWETAYVRPPPSSIPMAPPINVSVAASTRNCHRISPCVAPSALRTPISRVRSVTLIIITATTPTPPTIRPTPDSAIITTKNTPVSWFHESRILSWVAMLKVLSWPGRRPRSRRSVAVTSSMVPSSVATCVGTIIRFAQPQLTPM